MTIPPCGSDVHGCYHRSAGCRPHSVAWQEIENVEKGYRIDDGFRLDNIWWRQHIQGNTDPKG